MLRLTRYGLRDRKFARDIWITTIGVLIALALGAIATEIGWLVEAAAARRALGEEIGELIGQARERERADACIEAKLDAIGAILNTAEQSNRLPPVGRIGNPMYRTWSRGVWDSTVGADIASHMSRTELDNLSGAYQFVDIINERTEQEVDAWTRLYAIVGPGRTVSKDEVAQLRQALSEARMTHRYIVLSSVRFDQIVQAFDLPLNHDTVAEHLRIRPGSTCAPIEAPDDRGYGEAPGRGSGPTARKNPITRDNPGTPRR